ncbi:ribosome biogenesis protein SLX9 homolog [Wyeomyia smithii]|uniref:ribosome biogenesis protein SLX9 homolog n=1 Tax=Wyeomyia smithii TaxID=174621 RepID=UPI0024680D7A|nr:ribosome biogenesis protein SLX9 homolog [Wyeomyia smithii]
MGRLNKKLVQVKSKLLKEKNVEHKIVPGPFPIYRSTPVQLNGPEPESFKIPTATKGTGQFLTEVKQSPLKTIDIEDDKSEKCKKLRKLAISRLNKKDKKKFRKEELLNKIKLTQASFKEDKEKKKREKTVVTGDMRPLLDALPSLDSLIKLKATNTIKTGVPEYERGFSRKNRRGRFEPAAKQRTPKIQQYNRLNQVLNSKQFKKNPKKMIAEYIRNTRREQQQLLFENF